MEIQQYGLIGRKLEHSFSKAFFAKKFENEHISADYSNYEIPSIEGIRDILNSDIQGFNVTIPYKKSIIPYLDEVKGVAAEINAVNTVKNEDGKWVGYNTDVFGFRQMIKPFFKSHHERAMILGTGGAAEAVAFVLEQLGANVIYISRDKTGVDYFNYEDINENMIRFNGIIVNTTPLGTYPKTEEFPSIPYPFLTDNHLVIDLIYNPAETVFLKRSRLQGAVILNGKTMLHQQAEEAWRIWNK
jgi:shikimate dehydrogenase